MDFILTIWEYLASIVGIVGVIYKIYSMLKKFEEKLDSNFTEMKRTINKQAEIIKEQGDKLDYNTIETLRLVIINENIPLVERVKAGREYIKMGGNGAIKILTKELEIELEHEYMKGSRDFDE